MSSLLRDNATHALYEGKPLSLALFGMFVQRSGLNSSASGPQMFSAEERNELHQVVGSLLTSIECLNGNKECLPTKHGNCTECALSMARFVLFTERNYIVFERISFRCCDRCTESCMVSCMSVFVECGYEEYTYEESLS